ncbi:MAG TPA: hypothetical protein VLY23_11815 [Candidatus Acidoferrum sp.]|nr:hypothetical protein [Candidatus Acidoferrum sp.]
MENLQAFQDVALKNGFVDAEEAGDGDVLWLKKQTANAEDRICIDRLANNATIFWATIPWKINSKTFRTASALQDWLISARKTRPIMTNREALLRLAANKNDRLALTSLCESNAELIRVAVTRYFEAAPDLEKAQSMVMDRVADHARLYETQEDPDEWLTQSVNSQCDRLRNELIQEKAGR